jgi:transposase-like protein
VVCRGFLKSLVERGLHFNQGLYCVVDGAKRLHRAVETVFVGCVVIQRCRWHKRENVLAYLPTSQRPVMRWKLQAAYQQPTYEKAKAALKRVGSELALSNQSAARSLDKGLEETLTRSDPAGARHQQASGGGLTWTRADRCGLRA